MAVDTFGEPTEIHERMPGAEKFHVRAFRRLYDCTVYKTKTEGIEATRVDPAYASKQCSKCRTTLDENRPTRARFGCQTCGYEVHADYNVAKNIGFRRFRAG